jgi:glycosyltransferase involved in cell wall biosynthesis
MTEAPLVSVKMITYNHKPYIARAIEGVLQQKTNFPFELVIGEDFSTDGTREIVFEYQKKYPDIIHVITSDENVGMRKNSNRTRKACRGKYLAFCEGDDYWQRQDKMQIQVDYLEKHPKCGLVCSSYDIYHPGTQKKIKDYIKYRKWKPPENPTIDDLLNGEYKTGGYCKTCTVMLKRILCEQIIESDPYLHQSDHFLMGDTQLWTAISAIAPLHYIPDSLATYSISDESATRSKDTKKLLRFSISVAEMYLYLFDKYKPSSSKRHIYESMWFDCSMRLAFHEGNGDHAANLLKMNRNLSWQQWLFYLGAKNRVVYNILRKVVLLKRLIVKGQEVKQYL